MVRKSLKSGIWSRRILIAFGLMLTATLVYAGPPRVGNAGATDDKKMSRDLEGRNASDIVDVIVQYRESPRASHHQKVLGRGGILHRPLELVKSGAYRVPAGALKDLADDPEVAYISPDRPVVSTGTWVNDYHTRAINAAAAWSAGLNGSGIGVALIDSGVVSYSPDLPAPNIVYSQNFVFGAGTANDQYGHGTHVAGIIAGSGSASSGTGFSYTFYGIAPGVKIVSLKVLDQHGVGTDSEVIE